MININDIIEIDEKKKRIKKEIYTKIYDQFSSKIKQCVELGHKQVFLTVPVILIGYPVFDRNAAARYLTRQFELGGFIVQLVADYDIYVSWNISKKKREREVENEDIEFPNLMNLKKMANKYRGNGA
jgi:hypothetical protein|tara:strand:+ start:3183 stop:3563 length:381 start_codon:yes stop_codon:yes gene_type:complete